MFQNLVPEGENVLTTIAQIIDAVKSAFRKRLCSNVADFLGKGRKNEVEVVSRKPLIHGES